MPVQSRNVLLDELYQGCSPCPVKGSAKSPRTFLVSSESKAIRFQRKDELLELFPGCHIRKRSKERRALRLALDHLSFTWCRCPCSTSTKSDLASPPMRYQHE